MDVPDRIRRASRRLKEGHGAYSITVRDFLSLFGATRRGSVLVEEIRRILDSLDLQTEPDFESAWIDEPIWLRLKGGTPDALDAIAPAGDRDADQESLEPEEIVLEGAPSAVKQDAAPISAAPEVPRSDAASESFDPTFRIGSLQAANKALVSVNQDDSIKTAATLMLRYDYSQLPVMRGEREVKGMVTWKSICSRLVFGHKIERVGDCYEDARVVDANRTIFEVIPTIVEYGYVLVRGRERKITGIVTASDLTSQFHSLTEPFLLLREIELHVRRLIRGKLDTNDFACLVEDSRPVLVPQEIADLTFGRCAFNNSAKSVSVQAVNVRDFVSRTS
jgi:CBS domain-containing protein